MNDNIKIIEIGLENELRSTICFFISSYKDKLELYIDNKLDKSSPGPTPSIKI